MASGIASGGVTMRWTGEAGRLEVWYTTITDPTTGTGFWLHSELVAPKDGTEAFVHGWAAVFPPDRQPVWERFGPSLVADEPTELVGSAGTLHWDLRITDGGGPTLYTFPRYAWERQLLPAAQVVPAPAAVYAGTFNVAGKTFDLTGARGATARIYGHGNAKRWGWLHADLGDGDVLEIVSAVSTRPGLAQLPPITLLQLRVDGRDLSRDPLLAAPLLRARLRLPEWQVRGVVGRRRIGVQVHQDPERTVAIQYTDPDGATATCHNSEVASVDLRLEKLSRGRWVLDRQWHLDRTAHAEIGVRP